MMENMDRVLSADTRSRYPSAKSMTNMQKASQYRVSSITCTRTKSRIGRREKPPSSTSTVDREYEEADDTNVNTDGFIGTTPETKFLQDDDAFEFELEELRKARDPVDRSSQVTYHRACKVLHHSPVTAITQALITDHVILKHHVLGPARIKACAIALVENITVKKLHLEDNDVGVHGANYLAQMLEENVGITDLTISYNNIGRDGLRSLSSAIVRNDTVTKLDLSGNNFEDGDARYIVAILEENPLIRELRIHHNRFQEQGAIILAEVIGDVNHLEVLDLSWNHIRRKGAIAISESIAKNSSITDLNLSWNGFSQEGCKALAKALAENSTILCLNLDCNRVDKLALEELIVGIKQNKTLTTLRIAENPLTTENMPALLTMLEEMPDSNLEELDISSHTVSTSFCQKLENLQKTRRINVKHGRVIDVDFNEESAEETLDNEDPMMVLMEFMRLRNLRLVDLFRSLDTDGSQSLTRKEFKDGLQGVNIPVSNASLDRLLDKLDTDGDGEVDFGELMAGQKRHKTKLHLMKKKMGDSGTGVKSELARIAIKLQRMMVFCRRQSLKQVQVHTADLTSIAKKALASKAPTEANIDETNSVG